LYTTIVVLLATSLFSLYVCKRLQKELIARSIYTGDAVYVIENNPTTISGPFPVMVSPTSGGRADRVTMMSTDKDAMVTFHKVHLWEYTLLVVRHDGRLNIATTSRNSYESSYLLKANLADEIGKQIPFDREVATIQAALPHVTTLGYLGIPIQKLPASGLSLANLSNELKARDQYGIVLASDITPDRATATLFDKPEVPLTQWASTVSLSDGRTVYVFQSPVSTNLNTGQVLREISYGGDIHICPPHHPDTYSNWYSGDRLVSAGSISIVSFTPDKDNFWNQGMKTIAGKA